MKTRLRQIFYDLTHRQTCMCSRCGAVVQNIGWSLCGGIFWDRYYFPEKCPECGD